jgi:hypothetical protein
LTSAATARRNPAAKPRSFRKRRNNPARRRNRREFACPVISP